MPFAFDLSLVELRVEQANGKLEFTVSDNGQGFDRGKVRRGNGLDNMQQRADAIGASLSLQSKPDEGTVVLIQLKIT